MVLLINQLHNFDFEFIFLQVIVLKKNNKNSGKAILPFHTLLLGIYPVLALYSLNSREIPFTAIRQAVITSGVVTLVIAIFFLLIFRSLERASIFASLTLLMFFLYGHVFDVVGSVNQAFGRHRFLIPIWIMIFLVCMILLSRQQDLRNLTKSVNTISLLLITAASIQILIYFFQVKSASGMASETLTLHEDQLIPESSGRDVYYILVDTFGRQDVIAQDYEADISVFTAQLTHMGFYIATCSQSNYDYTVPSLTSSLNMQYLDVLGVDYSDDKERFSPLLQHSLVRTKFEDLGYSTITFKSLYPALDILDSTYYFDYFEDETDSYGLASLNFQYLFLRTTVIRPILEYLEVRPTLHLSSFWAAWIPVNTTLTGRDYQQYQQNVFALDSLEALPDLPDKKFVYAHLYTMHQPFVFDANGDFHPALAQDNAGYRAQVAYTTRRLLEIVSSILEKSEIPPVIIIQGDHSYSKLANRVKIMNAYYLPEGGDKYLYPSITPVNTFRTIFNIYFGGEYELLPDTSYYGDEQKNLYEASPTCMGAPPS